MDVYNFLMIHFFLLHDLSAIHDVEKKKGGASDTTGGGASAGEGDKGECESGWAYSCVCVRERVRVRALLGKSLCVCLGIVATFWCVCV